ncbi:hypothetical protein [Flagellimonas pacifica]|uniref:DUF3325 domain-containing protein n=1 Tax=Flagellimonas pacifica TaxID=1247520 RepID=A0A285MDZ3_9FLAO|nr:hypothetical protein [Allomuricauda parva]SNY95392.1 hypothetical protein SAMN06265377_1060 [Allomuricauda parva]
MLTIIIAFFFLGFFLPYLTSKRNKYGPPLFLEKLTPKINLGLNVIGIFFLVIGFTLLGIYKGVGTGLFWGFILLTTVGSIVILISPLKMIDYKSLVAIFAGFLILELTLS